MTRARRRLWLGAAVGLAALLAPQVSLQGARARILRSLQNGLGRTVRAQAVHLRLLPLPGVELDQVRLGESPAFGVEDMVVADDAVATVRLWPLLGGHLVFGRVHLDDPSINLVRNAAGDWNIAALLDGRAPAASAPAPLAGPRPPAREQMPYIEWSDARINFKLDQTKTRFYLAHVDGSLARESTGWRLQASFQPQRTDLNVSNTGDVTVDGRWGLGGGGFRRLPFDLVLRLDNSYLAASSALLVGHDAGVHGIVSARIHVQGNGQQFQITGTVGAHAVRRWDMLPPAATVETSFAGEYFPGQDRFVLDGAGDVGWRHLRLRGEVNDLFGRPRVAATLRLRQFGASDLLPLVMAVKAGLAPGLRAEGTADGSGALQWERGGAVTGSAQFQLAQIQLSGAGEQLDLPAAQVVWNGRELTMPAAAATIAPGVPLRVSAQVNRQGFGVELASAALTSAAAAGVARLFGVAAPWPAPLGGVARAQLGLSADWSSFRQAVWRGGAYYPQAVYQASGTRLDLTQVSLNLAAGAPPQMRFTAAPLSGVASWPAHGPPQINLINLGARRLAAADLWSYLHPAPSDLVQRLFGGTTPDWLSNLRARGQVTVGDLNWNGIHTSLLLDLDVVPGDWRALRLQLKTAGGSFLGSGRLRDGTYQITGATAAPLLLASLLAPTPYRGQASGTVTGTIKLQRAPAAGMDQTDAEGTFLARHGTVATDSGPRSFDLFAADYALHNGTATLAHVRWQRGLDRWTGTGTVRFSPAGARFALDLAQPGQSLRLAGGSRPGPSRP